MHFLTTFNSRNLFKFKKKRSVKYSQKNTPKIRRNVSINSSPARKQTLDPLNLSTSFSRYKHDYSLRFLNKSVAKLPKYKAIALSARGSPMSKLNQMNESLDQHVGMRILSEKEKKILIKKVTSQNNSQKASVIPSTTLIECINTSLRGLQELDKIARSRSSQLTLPQLSTIGCSKGNISQFSPSHSRRKANFSDNLAMDNVKQKRKQL